MLSTYVINLDNRPDRWDKMVPMLDQFGIVPIRWPATPVDGISIREWDSASSDPNRRVAIMRSHRTLLEHLATTKDREWLILQDDITLTEDPLRRTNKAVHLYGGYPPDADPTTLDHVCPQAFKVTRKALEPLTAAWGNETLTACQAWAYQITPATTSFDNPPTANHHREP